MKKFKVNVTETSTKTLIILAEDKRDAFKIIEGVYQKYAPFFCPDDIEMKNVSIKNEEDIDSKYLKSVDLVDNDLLVCELEESKYYMYEDAKYSLFDIGLIKKENDIVLITNIFYTDDCPDEKDNIIFYFKTTRSYGVLDYQTHKSKTINEIFALEKELYSSYPKCEADMHSYFVLETDIPFQELTSEIIHDLHYKDIQTND